MRTTTRFLITLVALITTTASAWAQVKKVPGDSNPGTGIGGVTIIDTPAADPNAFTKGDDGKWTLAEFPAYTAKLNIQYEALPTITLPASLTGGTLACTVGGKEQTYAEAGQTVTLTATPQNGYVLKSLTVSAGGEALTYTQDAEDKTKYTFTMPDADVTVEAEFAELPSITFAAQNDNTIQSGKATVKVGTETKTVGDDGKLSGLHEGDKVTVTAKEGYKFRKAEAQQGSAAPTTVSFTVLRTASVNLVYTDGNYTVAAGTTWQQFIDSGEAPACLSIGDGIVWHDLTGNVMDCGGTPIANTADKKFVKPDDAIIDGATYGCNDCLGYGGHD